MTVLSLSYWESDVYWRQNNKNFAELAPQNGGKQLIWRNYVTVTLCIRKRLGRFVLLAYSLWLFVSTAQTASVFIFNKRFSDKMPRTKKKDTVLEMLRA